MIFSLSKTSRYTLYANRSSGFIALISVMIISLVLLFAVISIGQRGLTSRFLLLDLERKVQTENLANACVESARIYIANDPTYSLSTPIEITVGSEKCTIFSITPSGGQSTIKAYSVATGGATTNLEVVVNSNTVDIVSKKECKLHTGTCN
jgi:hypothetical protein